MTACPNAGLFQDFRFGREFGEEITTALARQSDLGAMAVSRLRPAGPAAATASTLLVTHDFLDRWKRTHGEAARMQHEGSEGPVCEPVLIRGHSDSDALPQCAGPLHDNGEIAIGLDTREGFYALRLFSRENAQFDPAKIAALKPCIHELGRLAKVAEFSRRVQQESLLDVFDSGGTSAFVTDEDGWVKAKNAHANDLLGELLHFSSAGQNAHDRLDHFSKMNSSRFHREPSRSQQEYLTMPGGRRIMIYTIPLKGPVALFPGGDELVIAWDTRMTAPLVAQAREKPNQPLLDALQKTFGLTKTEGRLAMALVGAGLKEAAKELSISYETARSHLKSIFARTDLRSQNDVAALISRFAFHERIRETFIR